MTTTIDGQALPGAAAIGQATGNRNFFAQGGPSFKDVLDSVNPLQQLPGVGAVYRSATGDSVSPAAKIAGGALFGGPIGAIIGAVDAVVEMVTGSDTGSHVMAALDNSPPPPPVDQATATQMAAASLAAQNPVAPAAPNLTGISLASARSAGEALVYERQERLYGEGQGLEKLYGQTAKKLQV